MRNTRVHEKSVVLVLLEGLIASMEHEPRSFVDDDGVLRTSTINRHAASCKKCRAERILAALRELEPNPPSPKPSEAAMPGKRKPKFRECEDCGEEVTRRRFRCRDCRKPSHPATPAVRLRAIAKIIESVDRHCKGYNGECGDTLDEMTADEMREIYYNATGHWPTTAGEPKGERA